jgi:hypothetical protein
MSYDSWSAILAGAGSVSGAADVQAIGDSALSGFKALADGQDPSARFFTRFLARLGTHTVGGVDALSAPDGRSVSLSGAQVMLLARWYGATFDRTVKAGGGETLEWPGLSTAGGPTGTGGSGQSSLGHGLEIRGREVPVRLATITRDCGGFGVLVLPPAGTPAPGADAPLSALQEARMALGRLGGFAMRSIGRLFAMSVQRGLKVELEGGPSLRRTKDTTPGETKIAKATVVSKAPATQYDACLQQVEDEAGLSGLRPPKAGAVSEATVLWRAGSNVSQSGGKGIIRIGQPVGQSVRSARGIGSKSDKDGVARIDLEGEPQQSTLPPSAAEIHVPATVFVEIQDLGTASNLDTLISSLFGTFTIGSRVVKADALRVALQQAANNEVFWKPLHVDVIDHASDYKADFETQGVHLTGTICAGHGTIVISGSISGQGITESIDGTIDVALNPDDTGTYTGRVSVTAQNIPGFSGGLSVDINGNLRLNQLGNGQAELDILDGTFAGQAAGNAGGVSLSLPVSGTGNGSPALPLTPISFCPS